MIVADFSRKAKNKRRKGNICNPLRLCFLSAFREKKVKSFSLY
jgi:hypothetical protein